MKAFAHSDRGQQSHVDINAAISSTLTVARHELDSVAETVTQFGELPPVPCYPGDLNHVFLNLLVNAAHAIGETMASTNRRGRITVVTRSEDAKVIVSISDTGGGISDETRPHIFEPFFTTKAVGKGSGQGLALAHGIVVEKHGGFITLETEVGRGTTFHVRLPVAGAPAKRSGA